MLSFLGAEKRKVGLVLLAGSASAAFFGAALGLLLPAVELLLGQTTSLEALFRSPAASWIPAQVRNHLLSALRPDGAGDSFDLFLGVTTVICVLGVLGGITQYLQESASASLIARVTASLRQAAFERLIDAPLLQLSAGGVSDKTSRLVSDSAVVGRAYNALTGRPLLDFLRGLTAVVIAFVLQWEFTLLALTVLPLLFLVISRSSTLLEHARLRALERHGRVLAAVQQSLSALHLVKVHQAEHLEKKRFAAGNVALATEEISIGRIRASSLALIETLSALALAGLATGSAWYIIRAGLEPARFISALIILTAAAQSLRIVTRASQELAEGQAAFGRLSEILQWPSEQAQLQAEGASAKREKVTHQREILFDDVSFGYPGRDPAVNRATLRVGYGQKVALLGPNGAGKTTLLHLLVGLLKPDAGRVLIDGVSLSDVDLAHFRRQVAIVPQEPSLFEGTIAENIAYGLAETTPDAIAEASRAASAHQFIVELPDGYQSRLGEMGTGLSPGQKQRIAIARAILRDPRIMILDEPTNHVDIESEAAIRQTLDRLGRGRTVFIIAHRPETTRNADLVVVMHHGRVVAAGSHRELAGSSDLYRAFVRGDGFSQCTRG